MNRHMKLLMEILADEEALLIDEFEDALIGYLRGSNIVAVYDYNLCIHTLMEDNMTYEQAMEHMEYKVVNAYVGEKSPIFISVFS